MHQAYPPTLRLLLLLLLLPCAACSPGIITVGSGPPGTSPACQWRDPDAPPPEIQHVGLSCWDKHVSYRRVALTPPLDPTPLAHQLKQQQQAHHQQQLCMDCAGAGRVAGDSGDGSGVGGGGGVTGCVVPSLLQLAMEAVAQWLKASNVCDVLQVGHRGTAVVY